MPADLDPLIDDWSIQDFHKNWCETTQIKMDYEKTKSFSGRKHYVEDVLGIKCGTILLFKRYNTPIFHCGLYLGDDTIVHMSLLWGQTHGELIRFCNVGQFLNGNEYVTAIKSNFKLMTD